MSISYEDVNETVGVLGGILDSILDYNTAKDENEIEAQKLLLAQQGETTTSTTDTTTAALLAALSANNQNTNDNSQMYTILILLAVGVGLYFFLKK